MVNKAMIHNLQFDIAVFCSGEGETPVLRLGTTGFGRFAVNRFVMIFPKSTRKNTHESCFAILMLM